MRYVFIVNPAAGKEDSTQSIRSQLAKIDADIDVKIIVTKKPGEAETIARTEASKGDEVRIYACGGDGTANEVLTGVAGYTNCALGIIPIGSGNDFVRAMDNFSREDFLDVAAMVQGNDRAIDLIECGGRYCMNILSVGFDCSVANNVERFKKLPLVSGSLAYKFSILYCLFTQRKHPVRIYVDGKCFEKADYSNTTLLAIAGNGKYYGGGIKAAPYGDLCDGYMEFVHAQSISVMKLISLLGKFTKGEHIDNPKLPFVTYKRCKEICFEAQTPLDVNLDGEIFTMENPKVKILPGFLRIIEPSKAVTDKTQKNISKKTEKQGIF